jgi:hypothetical protein
MADENWQQIRKVFDEALRRNPAERPEFVRRECGENTTVREEVNSLLSSLDSAETFLETPVVANIADVINFDESKSFPGSARAEWAKFIWRKIRG